MGLADIYRDRPATTAPAAKSKFDDAAAVM
jgi:hypothetical protein